MTGKNFICIFITSLKKSYKNKQQEDNLRGDPRCGCRYVFIYIE